MIDWPAVIKYEGDDELVFVDSAEAWQRDAASHLYNHRGSDYLVDSSGRIFHFDQSGESPVSTTDSGDRISLDAFIRLVRIHASTSHRCCIEKISFRSAAEGIRLVADMSEQD